MSQKTTVSQSVLKAFVGRWLPGVSTVGACLLVTALAGTAQAQTIFRIVGPDGRVTFSDKPPPDADKAQALTAGAGSEPGANGPALPFALRQPVAKYPVTLYTAASCASCDEGRSLLRSRGVPFAEKTIATAADVEAFRRINEGNTVPVLTIGSQLVKGFSSSDWTQYLNAAGYPEKSVLPAAYRQPAASPLAAVPASAAPPSAPEAAPKPPAMPPAAVPRVTPDNPAGIQF